MNWKHFSKLAVHKFVNLALIGAALTLIISSIIVYNTWPIYTATNIIPQQKAQFPAVTFCGLSSGYKEEVLQVGNVEVVKYFFKTFIAHKTYIFTVYFQIIFTYKLKYEK